MAQHAFDPTIKYVLGEGELPTRWYKIQADFKTPAPAVLHPGTHQPIRSRA
jgi:tryptophan synthase beta chain